MWDRCDNARDFTKTLIPHTIIPDADANDDNGQSMIVFGPLVDKPNEPKISRCFSNCACWPWFFTIVIPSYTLLVFHQQQRYLSYIITFLLVFSSILTCSSVDGEVDVEGDCLILTGVLSTHASPVSSVTISLATVIHPSHSACYTDKISFISDTKSRFSH